MGIFPFSIKIQRKSQPVIVGEATSTFFPLSFVKAFLSGGMSTSNEKLLEYYLTVPELQAVINYRARVFSSMVVKARNIKDKKEIENLPFLELMKNPNPIQGFTEFAKQYLIGRDIFGDAFHNVLFGVSKKPENTKALWNLPAINSEIVPVSNKVIPFNQSESDKIIKEYKFGFNGGTIEYKPEEIIHFNDNQIVYNENKWLKGSSKILPLTQACENIRTAYEVRGILQGNSPLGIISNKTKDGQGTIPMLPADKKTIQDDLKKYGAAKDKYSFIVTSADIGWASMAVNISGLKLFEEVDADQSSIADAYSFPVELFQNNVTFENKKEAKKQLYQDSIIPEATEWLQGISIGVGLIDKGIELYPDFSHIAVLQDDLEKRSGTWLRSVTALEKAFASNAITMEQYQENLQKIGML